MDSFRTLDSAKILATAERLRDRILERFPDSGLGRVASELHEITRDVTERVRFIRRPIYALRLLSFLLIAGLAAAFVWALTRLRVDTESANVYELLGGIDAGLSVVIITGALILFLVSLEIRFKRHRVLNVLHELRAMAHVVEMHQLTKDPEHLDPARASTPSSPQRKMSPFQLGRYLDYCSELVSLISKIGALYVQNLNDPVALSAVQDIEVMTSGISRKVWQKMFILEKYRDRREMAEEG